MGYTPPWFNLTRVGTAWILKAPSGTSGDEIQIFGNTANAFPFLQIVGNSGILAQLPATGTFTLCDNTTANFRLYYDGSEYLLESMVNNRDLHIKTTGSGVLKFGSYTAGAATDSTGYITIKDTAGNTRKLMVQA